MGAVSCVAKREEVLSGTRRMSAIKRENEINRTNPTESLDNWRKKLQMEVGRDPLAVIRDFPRMEVFVGNGEPRCGQEGQTRGMQIPGRNPLKPSPFVHVDCNNECAGDDVDLFLLRFERVRRTVLHLSELCDERDSYGMSFEKAWDRLTSEQNCAIDDAQEKYNSYTDVLQPMQGTAQRAGSTAFSLDVHQLLQSACLESGMIIYDDDECRQGSNTCRNARTECSPLDSSTNGGNSLPCASGKDPKSSSTNNPNTTVLVASRRFSTFRVCSATFHLMEYMTQGVMFFPIQRLAHVLWVPWGAHMQDVAWTVRVYVEPMGGHTHATSQGQQRATTMGSGTAAHTTIHAPHAQAGDSSSSNGQSSPERKIIVVEHRQTGRHYVERSKRSTIPRYEVDWLCSIRINHSALTNHYKTPCHSSPVEGVTLYAQLEKPPNTGSCPSSPLPLIELQPSSPILEEKSCKNSPNGRYLSGGDTVNVQCRRSRLNFTDYPCMGVRPEEQATLVPDEVVHINLNVTGVRVEKPPRKVTLFSFQWKEHHAELEHLLDTQFGVKLDDVTAFEKSSGVEE